jgi:Mg2+ and Co2+ transporter CorA
MGEETSKVAKFSQRDSTDMRIIAAVTLIFLPGTFTATLFSTSFFNFQKNTDHPQAVSQLFWIYWVSTVALMLFVIGAWVLWSQRERLRLSKETTVDL